jgi:Holliday junction resolvase-like predicted endonuclease
MTMWVYPDWTLWMRTQPPQRPPGRRVQILVRVRHPSFTADQLDDLLCGLSRRQQRRLWRESAHLLDTQLGADIRFNVVLLRERLLEHLTEQDSTRRPGG